MVFHPVLPRLTTLAFAPLDGQFPPLLQSWCTAQPGLPPLRCPASAGLASLLTVASADPLAALVFHVAQPPALLTQPRAGGAAWPCLW